MAALAYVLLCGGMAAEGTSSYFKLADVLSHGLVMHAEPSFSVLWGQASSSVGRLTVRIDGAEVPLDKGVEEQYQRPIHVEEDHIHWRVELPPQPAGGPHELQINSEFFHEVITVTDVLFGDVFICGGQSNMQMGMSDAWEHDMADVTAKATDGALQRIRMLTVDLSAVLQKCPPTLAFYTNYSTEHHTLPVVHGWEPVLPYAYFGPGVRDGGWGATYFSIVCLFFGIETFLQGGGLRPVGLISTALAGSAIEYHVPHSALSQCLDLSQRPHSKRLGFLPYNVLSPHPMGRIPAGADGILFARGIAPLSTMAVTAFVWYQGESNAHDPDTYQCLFSALISSWRAAFPCPRIHLERGRESSASTSCRAGTGPDWACVDGIRPTGANATPFLAVQLAADANFQGLLSRQRQAQLNVVRLGQMDNVALVPAFDLGDPLSPLAAIHPRNKAQIGRRLAAAAQVLVPHYSSPACRDADVLGTGTDGPRVDARPLQEALLSPVLDSVELRAVPADEAAGSEWSRARHGTQGLAGGGTLIWWVLNVTVGGGASTRMFAADTLGCFICCEDQGPFRLLGHHVTSAGRAEVLELEGKFETLGQGYGWYAAAASLPRSWHTLAILYAQEDHPGCALYLERERGADVGERRGNGGQTSDQGPGDATDWGPGDSADWSSPLFPFAFGLVPATGGKPGPMGARVGRHSENDVQNTLLGGSVEWQRTMPLSWDSTGRGRWEGQLLQPLDFGVRCERVDSEQADEHDVLRYQCSDELDG